MPSISATVTTPDGTCPVTLHTPGAGDRERQIAGLIAEGLSNREIAERLAVSVRTVEGHIYRLTMRTGVNTPSTGPWPAVIMYPDAGGIRETFQYMAERLARYGYAVLLPDVYYRHGDWEPFSMDTVFGDPEQRKRLMGMVGSVTPDMIASDAGAFLDFLSGRPEVGGDGVGACGYCMGGRTSLIVAGHHPDRIAAIASFHGGGLVTDDPTSPHLLADRIKATVYIGGAENDASFTPENAETLDKALTAAGVQHKIEFYPAAHGFAVPDNPPYHKKAADRHWSAMEDVFGSTLSG